ncbi:hypothetical protein [Qipengyuania sp. ASV99]|uniref:hypothetical protein n=1 Tax=Qipengyuania sp. ASV99 TaxID=3399681 RepID=UPI003A4C7D4C
MDWKPAARRPQERLSSQPYDRWISPEGQCQAEFHRMVGGFLIRFPGQGDFLLSPEANAVEFTVTGWPAPDCDDRTIINLYHNAIQPILGNHLGGLYLHGSAVRLDGAARDGAAGAVAFLGLSRGGKTTLAGSFAREGQPFLTEDVIDLRFDSGRYWVQPKRSKLRLFADSARYLLGENARVEDENLKQDVEAGGALPFAENPAPLSQIYILGTDHRAPLSIRQCSLQEAVSMLMPHAFILDVEDKARLRGHFARIADLSQDIRCYTLDFTRDYGELPRVRGAILGNVQGI